MKRFSLPQITILLIIFTTPLNASNASNDPSNLIESTCKKAGNYSNTCYTTLVSDPRSPISDQKTLARILLEDSTTYVSNVVAILQQLIQSTTDKKLIDKYLNCNQIFNDDVNIHFPQALDSFDSGKFGDAAGILNLIAAGSKSCEGQFGGGGWVLGEQSERIVELMLGSENILRGL